MQRSGLSGWPALARAPKRMEIGVTIGLQLWLLFYPSSPLIFLVPACGFFVHSAVRAELTGRDRPPTLSHALLLGLLLFAMSEDFRVFEPGLHRSGERWLVASVAAHPVCVVLWLYILWNQITLLRTLWHLEEVSAKAPATADEQAAEPAEEEHWHS